MSQRTKQYNSLKRTYRLLMDLRIPKNSPGVPLEIRSKAFRCIKNFPPLDDEGQPIFAPDGITND